MESYNLSLELTALDGVYVTTDPNGKKIVAVPVESAKLQMSLDKKTNAERYFLTAPAWANRENVPDQWGRTHKLEVSMTKEERAALRAQGQFPRIIGSLKPIGAQRQMAASPYAQQQYTQQAQYAPQNTYPNAIPNNAFGGQQQPYQQPTPAYPQQPQGQQGGMPF
jgi:hypothetical protein